MRFVLILLNFFGAINYTSSTKLLIKAWWLSKQGATILHIHCDNNKITNCIPLKKKIENYPLKVC